MPDQAPPSTITPPVIAPSPPKPTEFDYSQIRDAVVRKAAEKATAKSMKLGEEREGLREGSQRQGKALEKNGRKKCEKAKKVEKKSGSQHDGEVERLRLE